MKTLVGRANRTLETIISMFVEGNNRTWDKLLPQFRHAMNTATQSTTKVSLAFLFFGRHLEPIKSLRRNCEDREQVVQIKEKDWLEPEELRDLVCKHTNDDLDIQKNRFNKWRKDVPYFVSDIYFPFISLRKG